LPVGDLGNCWGDAADDLRDELEELLSDENELVKEPAGNDEKTGEPWEKDSDWWKE